MPLSSHISNKNMVARLLVRLSGRAHSIKEVDLEKVKNQQINVVLKVNLIMVYHRSIIIIIINVH